MIKLILSTRAERCEKPHMPSQFGRAHDDDELPGGGGGGKVPSVHMGHPILSLLSQKMANTEARCA